MNKSILVICVLLLAQVARSQVGIGITYGLDLYSSYQNPDSNDPLITGDGPISSFLLNLNIGPKIWLGLEKASISFEGQVSFSPIAMDWSDFKGMGVFSFPIMGQVQLLGLSGFSEEGGFGLTFGGGVSFTQTDLYFREEFFEDANREFYPVIFGQIGAGWGYGGYSIYGYVRYGQGDMNAQNWSIGVAIDQNLTHFKKLKKQGFLDD
jgi:hypothetical protein